MATKPFDGKLDDDEETTGARPFSGVIDDEERTLLGAFGRGIENTKGALETAARSELRDYAGAAQLISEAASRSRPMNELQQSIARETAGAVGEWDRAERLSELATAGGKVVGTVTKNAALHPYDTAELVAENLPYSAPGLAGSVLGGVGGAAVGAATGPGSPIAVPAGALIGSVGGGVGGGYPVEQGASFQERALQLAEQNGISPHDIPAMAKLIEANYDTLMRESRTKGITTAGVDAVLTRLTLGLGGVPGSAVAKEARAVATAVERGELSAAEGVKRAAELEARLVAENTLARKAGRVAGVTAGEAAGEATSEGLGQKLAYGEVNPVDAALEGILSVPQGAAMGLASGVARKALGMKDEGSAADAAAEDIGRIRSVADQDQANADFDPAFRAYAGATPTPAGALPAPGQTESERVVAAAAAAAPVSMASAADTANQLKRIIPGSESLFAHPTEAAAREYIAQQPDSHLLGVLPHPRVDGAFRVTRKSADAYAAEQAAGKATQAAELRQAQLADEEGAKSDGKVVSLADQVARSGPPAGVSVRDAVTARAVLAGKSAQERKAFALRSAPLIKAVGKVIASVVDKVGRGMIPGVADLGGGVMAVGAAPAADGPAAVVTWRAPGEESHQSLEGLLTGLRDAGFSGEVRLPENGTRAVLSTDNVVIRGASEQDTALGEAVARRHFGGNVEAITVGQDPRATVAAVEAALAAPARERATANELAGLADAAQQELAPAAADGMQTPAQTAEKVRREAANEAARQRQAALAQDEQGQRAAAPKKPAKTPAAKPEVDVAEAAQDEIAQATGRRASTAREQAASAAVGGEVRFVARDELPSAIAGRSGMSRQMHDTLSRLAKLFGKQIQVFTGIQDDGFVLDSEPNVIFINAASGIHPAAVLGHELLHRLRAENHQAYQALVRVIRGSLDGEAREAFSRYYNEHAKPGEVVKGAALIEEAVADLLGNRFTEEAFWQEVFAEVETQYGDGAKSIIQALSQVVLKLVQRVLAAFKGSKYQTDTLVAKEMEAIRAALVKATAAYMKSAKNAGLADAPIDRAAHAAATSPLNGKAQPTPAQKEAGNYAKGHIQVSGLDITIENPQGSVRSGWGADGKPWATTMKSHYGYFLDTIGRDKDHIDVFVRPRIVRNYDGKVFVVDQKDPKSGRLDEHKVMLGWPTREAAEAAYRENYAAGWDGIQAITEFSMAQFQDWLYGADTQQAAAKFSPKRTSDVGHKRTKAGDYVGAPPGMTPSKLGALRRVLTKLTAEGEPGRFWYEESSRAILAVAEGDKALAEKIAGLLAIYSPQATVSANTSMGLKALYQWMNGKPIKARFEKQDIKATAWMNGTIDEQDALQIKTGNFYRNLMREIDPARYGFEQQGATIDMWMARVFGYGTKAVGSEARYLFAEREVKQLAKELGWEPQQVQAALWVSIKSRIEAVADDVREIGKQKGWLERKVVKVGGKENISWPPLPAHREQYELMILKKALALPDEQAAEGIRKSKYNFGTALAERVGQISWEAIPGRSTGFLPGIFDAPLGQQAEYLEAMDRALRDEDGQDLIAKKLGLPVMSTAFGPSAWQMDVGAGAQTIVAIATDRDQGNKKVTVNENARALLNAYAAIRGLVLRQEAVVWHYPLFDAAKKNANGVQLDFGRDLTHNEVLELYRAIHAVSGREDWAPAMVPGIGVRVLNFSDVPHVEFHKQIKQAAQTKGVPDFHLATFQSDGDYISNDWVANPDGAQYKEIINGQDSQREARGTGRSDLQGWVERELRPRAERVNAEFAERYGWGVKRSAPRGHVGSGSDGVDSGARGRVDSRAQSPGRIDLTGVHFSRESRDRLLGGYFGTGIQSQEVARILEATDTRLKTRIYAYINEGRGVFPEEGVGSFPHKVRLENLYDLTADPLEIRRKSPRDLNAMESMVLDAGFDGYYRRAAFGNQGVAILMGKAALQGIDAEAMPIGNRGRDIALPAAETLTDSAKLMREISSSQALPAGQFDAADFRKLEPALYARLAATGAQIPEGQALYKGEFAQLVPVAKRSTQRLAPNGKPSKLTEEQWLQVRTPVFKQWFGDWEKYATMEGGVWNDDKGEVSKAVDSETGEPLVVYHGSAEAGFAAFEPERNARGTPGSFFADRRVIAMTYAGRRAGEADIDPDGDRSPGIYSAFLNIRNPLEDNFEGANWDGTREGQYVVLDEYGESIYAEDGTGYFRDRDAAEALAEANPGSEVQPAVDHFQSTNGVVDEAARYENDGAIIRDVVDNGPRADVWEPSDVFVVFDATQVKSAVANQGTFDPANPDIRRSPARSQTETPEFRRWFGDSKVVDSDGKPLVVYHGTNRSDRNAASGDSSNRVLGVDAVLLRGSGDTAIAAFDPSTQTSSLAGSEDGFFFTDDTDAAWRYANMRGADGAYVLPVYLSIKNPLIADFGSTPNTTAPGPWRVAMFKEAQKNGHDGIVFKNMPDVGGDATQYVAFRPEQIKSAIGNSGEFNPADPDIRRSPARTATEAVARFFGDIAQIDGFFQNPRATDRDLAAALKAVSPSINIQKVTKGGTNYRDGAQNWVVFTPGNKRVYIHDFGKTVQWNAAELKSGASRGSALYQAVFDWASNTGKIFEGDSQGVSLMGALRRTENMISSALKHGGDTYHMRPHEAQIDPAKQWDGEVRKKMAAVGFTGFPWATGEHEKNLVAMLQSSYNVVKALVPEIEDVQLSEFGDFEKSGDLFTDADFGRLADKAAQRFRDLTQARDLGAVSPTGSATLKRAAVFGTVSRQAGSEAGRAVLARLGAELRASGSEPLQRVAYSPRRDAIEKDIPADQGGAASTQGATVTSRGKVFSVREAPEVPGLYHVTTQLVKAGERRLPVAAVNTSQDAARAFAALSRFAVERLDGLVTDKKGKPLAVIGNFKGGIAHASVPMSTLIMELAKVNGAANLWLSHNHPSGRAELSAADHNIARTLSQMLDGSSVTFHGLSAMARDGDVVKWTDSNYDRGEVPFNEPAPHRVSVVERELIASDPGETITSPDKAKDLVQRVAGEVPGVMFLTAQNGLAAFVPVTPEEMGTLRTGGRLLRLFRAAAHANASAAIVAMPGGRVSQDQYANLSGALQAIEVKVLDGIVYGDGRPASSFAEKGLDSSKGLAFKSPMRGFFSPLAEAVRGARLDVQPAPQWKLWLAGNKAKLGLKDDEIQWSGIIDWLELQGKAKISKADLLTYLDGNGVRIDEVLRGDKPTDEDYEEATFEQARSAAAAGRYVINQWGGRIREDRVDLMSEGDKYYVAKSNVSGPAKYGDYQLPGGKNYRELLLTLPGKSQPEVAPAERPRVIDRGHDERGRAQFDVVRSGEVLDTFNLWGDAQDFALKVEEDENIARNLAREKAAGPVFRSSHWDEPNILAHIRFNERTDTDGARVLFIEEIQSDWGQQGKKHGFDVDPRKTKPLAPGEHAEFIARMKKAAEEELMRRTAGKMEPEMIRGVVDSQPLNQVAEWAGMQVEHAEIVERSLEDARSKRLIPSAPFVTDTKAWVTLVVKRMIAYAVEHDFDKVAFVNGEQSADRYDLSKQIGAISAFKSKKEPGKISISVGDKNDRVFHEGTHTPEELEDVIGKELAQRVIDGVEGESGSVYLEGLDLKVGGEGMKAFYDQIVPRVTNDVLKKIGGGKIGEVEFSGVGKSKSWPPSRSQQPGFEITPAMREKAAAGQALFSRRRQAESAAFKDWFGESKVVDGNGAPQVVYHGRSGDFTEFNATGGKSKTFGTGAFFTASPAVAASYLTGPGANIAPVFLSLQNPMVVEAAGANWSRLGKSVRVSLPRVEVSDQEDENLAADLEGRPATQGATKVLQARQTSLGNLFPDAFLHDDWFSTDDLARWARQKGYDGVIFRQVVDRGPSGRYLTDEAGEPADMFVAFAPEQIKSAIGNSGEFSASDPDIRRSVTRQSIADAVADMNARGQVLTQAKYKLADILAPTKGFNLWHKTIGTQLHKALTNPAFKKVFDLGQQFLDDVQLIALRAEGKAGKIFPKLDRLTLESLKNMGLSVADNKLIGRALTEGTLENGPNPHDGVVWTNDQLRSRFGMNDAQIALYREARAAINQSLEDLAMSEMVQHMRIQKADMDRVEEIGRADLPLSAKAAEFDRMLADMEAKGGKDYSVTRNAIRGIASTTGNLQRHGYAPLMRFGSRSVTGYDAAGKVAFFTMVDTDSEAEQLARQLKTSGGYAKVASGKMDTESFKLFKGVTPDTLELFATHAAQPLDDLMQEYLELAVSNRSAMKRLIERTGVSGYSDDATRTIANFITSNSRRASTNINMANMSKAVLDIPQEQGDVRAEAARLVGYIQNPGEEAARLRGFLFFQFLGGSIAAGIVNMTQPVMMTLPYLSRYGIGKASEAMTKGLADASNFLRGKPVKDADLEAAFTRAQADGHINPQEIYQLMAAANTGAGSFLSHKVQRIWGLNFSITESFNRTLTFAAAFRLARDAGEADPYRMAINTIFETQGIYNKGNRPNWARGAVGATIFTFKQYSISYLEFLRRLWSQGAMPKRQLALALGLLILAAGTNGLPGADDLDDLIDTVGAWLGYATNAKRWKREYLEKMLGKEVGELATIGISKYLPIDVQARLGLANFLPGTGLLNPNKADKGGEVAEVFGVAGGLVRSIGDAAEMAVKQDFRGAGLAVLPTPLRNLYQAQEMWSTGKYKDRGNKLVTEVSKSDAVAKAIGFQPAKVAATQRAIREAQAEVDVVRSKQTEFVTRLANAIADGDEEGRRKVMADLVAWNRNNPEYRVVIRPQTIRNAVKLRRMSKDQRFLRQVPRQVRERIGAEIQE